MKHPLLYHNEQTHVYTIIDRHTTELYTIPPYSEFSYQTTILQTETTGRIKSRLQYTAIQEYIKENIVELGRRLPLHKCSPRVQELVLALTKNTINQY